MDNESQKVAITRNVVVLHALSRARLAGRGESCTYPGSFIEAAKASRMSEVVILGREGLEQVNLTSSGCSSHADSQR